MLRYDMPKGVLQLNIIQIFSTIGFAVLLGTLNLYLQSKGMPLAEVNILTASFFALNFLLHFLGGALGGSFMSYRVLFLVSMVTQIVGLICIASPELNVILLGMACYLTGAGLNISCINMMITHRFDSNDMRRRTAFSVNYACMNIGFIIGFVIANAFQVKHEYSAMFVVAAIGISFALLSHILNWRYVPDVGSLYAKKFNRLKSSKYYSALIVIACFFVTWFFMHHGHIASAAIYVVFVSVLIYLLYLGFQQNNAARNKVIAFIVLSGAGLVYAFIQGLTATGMQNFIYYNTTMQFFGLHVEPGGFSIFESFGVIIFGFVLAKLTARRLRLKQEKYKASSLVTTGLGVNIIAFLIMPLGIWLSGIYSGHRIALYYPIAMMLLVALAEILVNTINFSLVGELISPKLQGLFTGYLFVNIAVGNNLAGPFSNLIMGQYRSLQGISLAKTNPMYFKMFIVLAVIAAVITLIYFCLARWLERLKVN